MNVDMLRRSKGSLVRLRPIARRHDAVKELPPIDDDWRIVEVDRARGLEIENVRTMHFVRLGIDAVVRYDTDPGRDRVGEAKHGILELRWQVQIGPGDAASSGPLLGQPGPK